MNSSLVKILKKYDKRTGALIRHPFIEKVLQQPFFTTDLLYKLVKECVAMLDHLFPSNNLSISAECDGQNGVPKPAQSDPENVPSLSGDTEPHFKPSSFGHPQLSRHIKPTRHSFAYDSLHEKQEAQQVILEGSLTLSNDQYREVQDHFQFTRNFQGKVAEFV
ncbi:SPX domain-containing protein 1-like [Zingiber officinale]|uniref:SPX domain-containing protein 1-like n=1 Tax=Zingiber officinale TaxID=94328 RepID=UPI001C4CD6A8|nr:SPX domain-containing protein 1-like [Zingiber officinale]